MRAAVIFHWVYLWSLRDSSRPSFPFGLFTPAFVTLSESSRRGVTGCHSQGVRTTRACRTIFHLSIRRVFSFFFFFFSPVSYFPPFNLLRRLVKSRLLFYEG